MTRTGEPDAAPARGHLRLGQLLALVAAGPALVIVAAVIVGLITVTHQDSVQSELLDRVQPASVAVLGLEIAMLNQETGVRGYELTGDPSFLAPYRLGRAEQVRDVQRLRSLAVPGTGSALTAAMGRVATWEAGTVAPALRRDANPLRVRDRLDTSLRAKATFDAVRASLRSLERLLLLRFTQVRGQLRRASRTTAVAFGVVAVALVVSIALAGLLLARFITRPVGRLARAARRVSGGDLGHRIELSGARDLELLAADVDGVRTRLLTELTASQAMEHQLNDAAAELRRSNTELEQFAYVASHDLQEPLRKVASFCQLLQDRYRGQLDERADQYIDFAVDGAKRMQQLISDLLAFSRVGRQDQPLREVSLNDLVDSAAADLSGVIEATGTQVSVAALPTLAVAPALMRTVFSNLLTNAIKFQAREAPRVRIDALREGAMWQFSCTDNGIGIDPEYAERIFVIFQRLHTREAYPGTGIGLSMCRKIVEHHGGRMWLDVAHQGGTRMCFTLPDTPDTPDTPAHREAVGT